MTRPSLWWLAALLVLASCTGDAPPPISSRDSAGVHIVESREPVWQSGAGWRIHPQPVLAIGVEEGNEPYMLHRVFASARLPDGSIVIGNSGTSQLRTFDANGKFVRAAGRRGAGPGEFHEFSSLQFCTLPTGDLLIADAGLDRMQIFAATGEHRRTFRLEHAAGSSGPGLRGCFADGTFLTANVPVAVLGGQPGSLIHHAMQYHRYDVDGRPVARLTEVPDRTRYVNRHGNITHYPFVPFTVASAAAAGAHAVFIGHGGSARIEKRDLNGALQEVWTWRLQRQPTAEVYGRYQTESLQEMPEARRAQYATFYARDLPLPDSVPAFQSLWVDELQHVWAERYRLPWDSLPVYDIFDPTGRWLGALTSVNGFELHQIARDFLIGRQRDELGVERVIVLRLTRQP